MVYLRYMKSETQLTDSRPVKLNVKWVRVGGLKLRDTAVEFQCTIRQAIAASSKPLPTDHS